MLKSASDAQEHQFTPPGWGVRMPQGSTANLDKFRGLTSDIRRRIWINGHQIGQVNALQRQKPFAVLVGELNLPSILLTFPSLFGATPVCHDRFQPQPGTTWVGGDRLRAEITAAGAAENIAFYDFGASSLDPLELVGVAHFPCLALGSLVIAMSMPDPAQPADDSESQLGTKPNSWGKLLPGWYLSESASGALRAFGSAAPAEGLALPIVCHADPEGFLVRGS